MSVSWGVVPFDPADADVMRWLQEKRVAAPAAKGRYPTMDELFGALTIFDGHTAHKHHISDNLWEVVVGEPHSETYAHMLGRIEEDGSFDFHFFGSWCRNTTMIAILKQIAGTCGPLIWYDDYSATPIVVTPDTDIDTATEDWKRRWNASNP